MKNKLLLTLSLCMALGTVSIAQTDSIPSKEKDENKKRFQQVAVDNTMAFKFDVLHILFNEINLGFEQKISKKATIELDFGPTISNVNLIGDNFKGEGLFTNSMFGYFLAVAYRFYPLDGHEAFNGFYFSPELKYKTLNTRFEDRYVHDDFPEYNQLISRVGQWNQASFTLNFGYQLWLSKKFSIDYFAGLGLGYRNNMEYEQDFIQTNYTTLTSNWKGTNEKGARYVITAGLKIGIGEKLSLGKKE
jgi:hypothetical protein